MDGVYTDKSQGLASTSSGSHWYVFTEKTWHTTSKVAVHLNFSWKSHFVTPYCLKVGSVGVVTDPESNVEIGNPSVTFSSNKWLHRCKLCLNTSVRNEEADVSQTNCTRLVKVVLKRNALLHCEQSHLSVCTVFLACTTLLRFLWKLWCLCEYSCGESVVQVANQEPVGIMNCNVRSFGCCFGK